MNLHEYQAKDLLRKYNLPLLDGKSFIENVDDLQKELQARKQSVQATWHKLGPFFKHSNCTKKFKIHSLHKYLVMNPPRRCVGSP